MHLSDLYVCPTCIGPLTFSTENSSSRAPASSLRRSGVLTCNEGHRFRVEAGLPKFVDTEGYAGSFGYQWKVHSRTQLDSTSGVRLSRERFFRGTGWPERMPNERILEAGCGSGRFTEVLLSTGADVVSFDYSSAAEVAHGRFRDQGARVCQASIYQMPYVRHSFDRVFCYGVIQHCPDVKAAFFKLVEMVKPGGAIALDVYDRRKIWFNARYRVRWLTKRLDKEKLYRACSWVVPRYMRFMPPMHPWNQLLLPIKDYRGALGLDKDKEIEWSVLDTFDALSPEYDKPQFLRTMRKWCTEAKLNDVYVARGGNGIEIRARQPSV